MSDLSRKLIRLQENIDKAKSEEIRIETTLNLEMKRLEKDYSVSTVKAATKLIDQLKEKKESITEKIDRIIERLEENYGEL